MSVRECVQDILALRALNELPTIYDGIRKWSKLAASENDPWSPNDLDDVEPDLVRWETIMFLFFEDTMRTGLLDHTRWETVRMFRVTFALQYLNANLWYGAMSKKPDKRATRSTRTLFADLLAEAGRAQKMDGIFEKNATEIFGLMKEGAMSSTTDITHETLEFRRSLTMTINENRRLGIVGPPSREETLLNLESNLLRRAICVADFYYAYHTLRCAWKSSRDLSGLMEKDCVHLQNMMDFLDVEPQSYKDTKIYHRFIRIRDHLNFALARRRGIVPSSFFVSGIKEIEDKPVGHGGFADVWKGKMEDGVHPTVSVALKLLRTSDVSEERRETLHQALYREAILWKMTNHPNVLRFIGLGLLSPGCIAMVSPWMSHGNLLTFVKRHDDTDRLELLSQAARGLYYLHKVNIIHGDLKCANIVVDKEGNAQLADFGLAAFEVVHASVTGSQSRSAGGTPRWQAPELLVPSLFSGTGRITRESDVYAFGMTALELFTEKVPFSHLSEPAFLVEVVGRGLEPEWPGEIAEKRGLTAEVWKWMRSCWEREPSARTSTEGLRADIVELASGSIAEINFTNRWFAQSVGRIRRVGKETTKRGWFDNAWNVELTVPMDGVPEKKEEWSSVTARVVNTAGLDGSRKTKLQDIVRPLRQLRHTNVARVLGLSSGLAPIRSAIIMDFGPNVDVLMTYLRENRIDDRLEIVAGIASGLEYLHRRDVVHGDLRTANIIVEDGVPKLVDYGLPSSFRCSDDIFVHPIFKAPELRALPKDHDTMPTSESDVYGLGVAFYEIFTERLPLDVLSSTKSGSTKDLPSIDDVPCHPGAVSRRRGLSDDLWSLIQECWATQASSRPSSRAVLQRIKESRTKALNSVSCFENRFLDF
ncbi:kinase-like protein [Schizopora paradoxa]|uniref:Kinase-like protein n=1 Tax=Schizopora paradoxa TaxID=27342 RepID=A0A0H2R930_9AGAM|nr:kinase-like protein [Schizopora paradoxa]